MDAYEREICQYIFDNGEMLHATTFKSDKDVLIEQYVMILEGEKYNITRHDRGWVYLFHYK